MSEFSRWLAGSALNNLLESSASWLIPTLQMIHILSIAVLISSMIMVHGRILRSATLNQSIPQAAKRFLPWMWVALVLLLLTGCLLIVMEPVRTLGKTVFWAKMIAVASAAAMTAWLHRDIARRPERWTREAVGPAIALFAVVNLGVWVFIIIAGRWIAYV